MGAAPRTKPLCWLLPALLLPLNAFLLKLYQYPQPNVPTSRRPAGYSTHTGLPYAPNEAPEPYDGYPDNRVLAVRTTYGDTASYVPGDAPAALFGMSRRADSLGHTYRVRPLPADLNKRYFKRLVYLRHLTPEAVWIDGLGLYADEVELPNVEWRHFMERVAADSGAEAMSRYWPLAASQPVPGYFTSPFFRYYPVVGISREQVAAYCRWRSVVTTAALAASQGLDARHPDYLVMRFRLPTEAEWECAAGRYKLPREPYGQPGPTAQVRVNPDAAAYLALRSLARPSLAEMERDINAFNKAAPGIVQFNCRRPVPYFLELHSPGYVFDLPQNFFGLYHMAGNVAELVQEPGLTKGGSYRDSLSACAIRARGRYTGPAPDVGFRCVCEISFPNRP